jgi:hypothetical protein
MAGWEERRSIESVCSAATASSMESAAPAGGTDRPTARRSHVVVVGSLAALDKIISRGFAPSLPPGSQVKLTVLPEDQPQRRSWERSLSRYASACGCQPAAAAVAFVIGALVAAYVALGVTLTLPGLPVYASWTLACVVCVVVGKIVALYIARQSLKRLGSMITAAANAAKES